MAERRRASREVRPAVHRPAARARAALRRDDAARRGVRRGGHLGSDGRGRGTSVVRRVHPPGQPRAAARSPGRSRPAHLPAGTADGRNVMVTSGTGSGKTESFLLPVLLRLVEESASWAPQPGAKCWWTARRRHLASKPRTRNPPRRGPCADPLPNERAGRRPDDPAAPGRPPHRRAAAAEQALVRPIHRRHAGRRDACPANGSDARVADVAVELSRDGQGVRRARDRGHGPRTDLAQFADPRAARDADPLGHDRGARQTSWSRTTRCSTRCSCAQSSSQCSKRPPAGSAPRRRTS